MFAAADRFAFLVKEVKREAADLRAVSAVGAPAFKGLTGVALTAVADAKRAVNKEFTRAVFSASAISWICPKVSSRAGTI